MILQWKEFFCHTIWFWALEASIIKSKSVVCLDLTENNLVWMNNWQKFKIQGKFSQKLIISKSIWKAIKAAEFGIFFHSQKIVCTGQFLTHSKLLYHFRELNSWNLMWAIKQYRTSSSIEEINENVCPKKLMPPCILLLKIICKTLSNCPTEVSGWKCLKLGFSEFLSLLYLLPLRKRS